ncbi:MAG: Succinate dehydrogenase [ubiquinone] iron-sulfur subunit, mitochondrial [Aureobasidium pullulans]|nr:MAG: Succinate dehydrogenase [ubiquinone] iron-sulfur subunit, mitochondrial [Aureobasidium pullulans]
MVKNMQGLSRKTSTQSFHNHINSPPPTFDFPLHLKENVERERQRAEYAEYLRQLELVHEQSKQCLRIEQQKLDSMLQSATQHAQSSFQSTPAAPIMATSENVEDYAKPFCTFLTDNPTVFHAVDSMAQDLKHDGFTKLSERDSWRIEPGGKYFVERNGSSLIAFVVGDDYKAGNGAAVLAGHVDALTAKLKPVSKIPNKAGYVELGVAPYAGGLGPTWWDRDLSIGGRVLVKEGNKIVTKLVKLGWPIAKIPTLVKLGWPIAKIPTLAPHFGAPANGPFNLETQVVPIIGLESSAKNQIEPQAKAGSFAATQPPRLVRAIAKELGVSDASNIVNWELELYDIQPATLAGLDKEFITAGRIDDKLCSWAALEALKQSARNGTSGSGIIKIVGLFDDEEIGSGLRQGARGNFLPIVMERAVGSLAGQHPASDLMGRTYANSFLVSSDVTHAVNPNFEGVYLANHAPELNVGVVVSADSNGHMTTDGVSTAIFTRCAEKVNATLQVFQIRNDSRSGGTVGPMLSCATGMRAIDAGIPQLSMHSIRATTGTSDPGLGVQMFQGFLDGFEAVDAEFRD